MLIRLILFTNNLVLLYLHHALSSFRLNITSNPSLFFHKQYLNSSRILSLTTNQINFNTLFMGLFFFCPTGPNTFLQINKKNTTFLDIIKAFDSCIY